VSGFLARLFAGDDTQGSPPGPLDDFWWTKLLGTATEAGVRVTADLALQVSAVFACVKVIAESMATLPLIVYERISDREKQRATDAPEYQLLHRAPNGWQSPYDFKENLTAWAALYGKGCAINYFGPDGHVVELDPVHPTNIKVEKLTTRRLRYQVLQPDGTWRPYVQGEIFHLRGFSLDGIDGVQLSTQAREAIALARAMESFGARYFANDTTIGLVLEHPGKLGDEAHARLTRDLGNFRGANQWRGKVLEEGMKLNRIQGNAREAQLTDARTNQVVEICRYFRMPPHKIAHLLQATFSNIEHQSIEFVTDTLSPWAVRWEEALTRDVILDDEKYFAEFLLTAQLRGDSAARSQYYRERFNIGTLSRNEIRALENENPIVGGDTYYVNAATIPLDDEGRPIPTPTIRDVGTAPPPAPDVPGNEPDPSDDDDETEDSSNALALAPLVTWVGDVADRLASAEAREVEKHIAKGADSPERFALWAHDWYGTHRAYAHKTFAPLAAAYRRLSVSLGHQIDAVELTQSFALFVASTGRRSARRLDPRERFDLGQFAIRRRDEIRTLAICLCPMLSSALEGSPDA
jgi:HK97 family phage portal protein